MKYTIPKDNDLYRDFYEPQGKGICGIAGLAVLLHKTCSEILIKFGDYKGFMPIKDLRSFLIKNNFKVKQKSGHRSKDIRLSENINIAICSIQFLGREKGKYHGHRCWSEASRHRHLILIISDWVFCNATGFFPRTELKKYLKGAYITSYLEIQKC